MKFPGNPIGVFMKFGGGWLGDGDFLVRGIFGLVGFGFDSSKSENKFALLVISL